MAIDHHRGDRIVAHPGEVVGATFPGQPETREGNHTMSGAELARLALRRKIVRCAAGASALFLFAGGAYAVSTHKEARPETVATTDIVPTQESTPARETFETKDLTMNRLAMPETLNKQTYSEIVAAVGDAIQYAVNKGDRDLIRRLIPGGLTGTEGTLQPGQFELRAAFIQGFRESSQGTGNDHPDDPQNERYYTWGFSMQLLDEPHPLDARPENVTGYNGLARITMGDLPPLPTLTMNELNMEPPKTFDVAIELTRYAIDQNGNSSDLSNIVATADGGWELTEEKGWGLASVGQMYPIPDIMAANYETYGFAQVPELFKES